jgi:hypothetical protein
LCQVGGNWRNQVAYYSSEESHAERERKGEVTTGDDEFFFDTINIKRM